ncbi:MAG: THUMP domain-containing protein [Burkholderiales bacterium]|jgi:putative N6-adenine-specific DNA methylase|nr:THUMP domain-containing protein [Burkholderiales bacterium]
MTPRPARVRSPDPRAPSAAERFFATCPRGLEAALADELTALGLGGVEVVPGGVAFAGDAAAGRRANLWSRIASRILWQVGSGRYRTEDDVYRHVHALPWRDWFDVDRTLRVQVSAVDSPLRSLEFITLRIKDAICDRFRVEIGKRPSIDTAQPDVRVHAFFSAREVVLYLDTSGEALFKRGWRGHAAEAPLRENLAAGLLRLTGWTPDTPLLDPMCGAGTLVIEAAQIALGRAPGAGRRFGFERLNGFDADAWKVERAQALVPVDPATRMPLVVVGRDIDAQAVAAARENARAAGVDAVVTFECADVLAADPPAPGGVLLTNPPYGVRLGDTRALQALYPRLGDQLKQRYAGWRAFFFSGDPELAKCIGLKTSRRTPLFNGALECRLYEYRMVAGSARPRATAPAGEASAPAAADGVAGAHRATPAVAPVDAPPGALPRSETPR